MAITLVGMTLLWLVVSNNAASMVKNGITNQMTDVVESRAAIIDEYVLSAEVYAAVTTVRVLVGVLCAAMAAGGVILADKAVRQGGREDEREETSGHIRRRFAPLRGIGSISLSILRPSVRLLFAGGRAMIRKNQGTKLTGGWNMRWFEDHIRDGQVLFAFLSEAETPPEKADFVLAMGSQDLGVADTAVRAFRETRADWLVCSGGFGKDTAALFQEPEALLYARRCREAGLPEERLILEDRASNSGENFQFSRQLLEGRGLFPSVGVIACKPYMAKRAWATGARQWPEVRWSVFPQSLSLREYLDRSGDPEEVFHLMTGDLQRLRVYAGGFQEPVEVPEGVWAAFKRLAAAGFDRYVLPVSSE